MTKQTKTDRDPEKFAKLTSDLEQFFHHNDHRDVVEAMSAVIASFIMSYSRDADHAKQGASHVRDMIQHFLDQMEDSRPAVENRKEDDSKTENQTFQGEPMPATLKRFQERITLHDRLLSDWGTDLPIRGGWGDSREDPVIITAPDPLIVATTRLLTLRGIGRGRGIFWRTVAHTLLGDPWPGIEQFKIETVRLTDTQARNICRQEITQTEDHYFNVSAMIAAQQRWLSPPVIVHHDVPGLAFPYEIGWLHYDSTEDYESRAPGLGYSLLYGAPGIKATLYVYDHGLKAIPDDLGDPVVQDEFERAADEIAAVHPDFKSDHPKTPGCLERIYRFGDDSREASGLWLTTAYGRFIKARVTWHRDPFIEHAANLFVRIVLENTVGPRLSGNRGSHLH